VQLAGGSGAGLGKGPDVFAVERDPISNTEMITRATHTSKVSAHRSDR
jgi:hypothetical protein